MCVCAVSAGDRGKETANFSSGERREGGEEGGRVLMSRIAINALKPSPKTNRHRGRLTD